MGATIYYIILASIIVFSRFMPQSGSKKKNYIIAMAVLHAFVSGFRYKLLTGDLQKYAYTFIIIRDKGWLSDDVFSAGRNFLFQWFLKSINLITNANFQVVLLLIAIFIEVAVAIVIFRHSPSPWLSYLIWNCFGFYIFGFSALKQSFAMAFVMLAFSAIMDKKPVKFAVLVIIAGCIHLPAFIFLPSYWIVRRKLTYRSIFFYTILVGLIFTFRDNIVSFVSDFYYEDTTFESSGRIGGRFLIMCMMLVAGLFMKGIGGKKFTTVFNIIAIGTVMQMFSTFDNIFTRLADYYLQMLIIYIPMIFTDFDDEQYADSPAGHRLFLGVRLKAISVLCLVVVSIAFYYYTSLRTEMASVDNYLNYRFSWEVSEDLWDEAVRIIKTDQEIR